MLDTAAAAKWLARSLIDIQCAPADMIGSELEPLGQLVPGVVLQHLEDAIALRGARSLLVRAPHIGLLQLGRADERLAAHLDGLVVAGTSGIRLLGELLRPHGERNAFVSGVLGLELHDASMLAASIQAASVDEASARGFVSALGWASAPTLRGFIASLLAASDHFRLWLGLCACSLHRVDPGGVLTVAIQCDDLRVRSRALRLAGELGRVDLRSLCVSRSEVDPDPVARLTAAHSAVLLGERGSCQQALCRLALAPVKIHWNSLTLAIMSSSALQAKLLVRELVSAGASGREVIRATALTGDIKVVPWLIDRMKQVALARVAGEAFCQITGVNLSQVGLEQIETQIPDNEQAETDQGDGALLNPDDNLPWPNAAAVKVWWQKNSASFPPNTPLVGGREIRPAHCISLITHGTQRLRNIAAIHLKILRPSQPLLNISAPMRRQTRWLAEWQKMLAV